MHFFDSTRALTLLPSLLLLLLDDEAEKGEDLEELEEDELEVDNDDDVEVLTSAPKAASVAAAAGASSRTGRVVTLQPPFAEVWHPIYIKAVYTDHSMHQHQIILILLPRGVGHTKTEGLGLFLPAVDVLGVTIPYPEWIMTQEFLKHLKREMKKGTQAAVDHFLQENDILILMQHAVKKQMSLKNPHGNALKATAHIKLDMAVKPLSDSEWSFFGDNHGVRMLWVDLLEASVDPATAVKNVNLA